MSDKSAEYIQRLCKLKGLREAGVDPYPNDFRPGDTASGVVEKFGCMDAESLGAVTETVSLAGRLMTIRGFGKASFAHIQDRSGRMQIYLKKETLGDEVYALFNGLDAGDFIGVEGRPFRTRTGELTIEVSSMRLLVKGLNPLPEKWHGLTNVEARYRMRYVDLMVNPESREVFMKRATAVRLIREFFTERDFIEVETPMMQAIPGGAAARPFVTHHNALKRDLYLRIAPELYLKRLVVGGFERVFEINRNFRNEGISTQHNPEFTMLEFYQAYADYNDMMEMVESLVTGLVESFHGNTRMSYQGTPLDFSRPWARVSVREAIKRNCDATDEILGDRGRTMELAKGLGLDLAEDTTHGKALLEIFECVAESKFVDPTFVTGYPVEVSPLARRNNADPTVTDRFELIVAGREIANAFSELNDPVDQRERFERQAGERLAGDDEAQPMDEDFLNAVEYGLPPTAGCGVGIDRLVMLLADAPSIRDVILFPHMRERAASGHADADGGNEQ